MSSCVWGPCISLLAVEGDLGSPDLSWAQSPEVYPSFCQGPLSWKEKGSSLLGRGLARWPGTHWAQGKLTHSYAAKWGGGVPMALPATSL